MFNGLASAIRNRDPWTYECYNHLDKDNKISVYAVLDINMIIKSSQSEMIGCIYFGDIHKKFYKFPGITSADKVWALALK